MSFLSPRRLILSTLFVIAFYMPGHAETSERQERIAAHLAGQMLATSTDDKITLSPSTIVSLSQAGLSTNRFRLGNVDVLRNDNDGDEQAITFLAVYSEETERRLWLVVRAWYDVVGDTVNVSRADPYWNSPAIPEIQLRVLPHNALSGEEASADTYAKNVELLGDIVAAAIDPAEALPTRFDVALTFIDRVAFDAEITLTTSATADGATQSTLSSTRLDATGWPIIVVDGALVSSGFLQVRYRPGSDRDPSQAQSEIIAAYSITELTRNLE